MDEGNLPPASYQFPFSFFFSLGYSHHTGVVGFTEIIPIRHMLYISYFAPIISPLNPLSTPLKAIARGFLVLSIFFPIYGKKHGIQCTESAGGRFPSSILV
jgi:hypothetical protein